MRGSPKRLTLPCSTSLSDNASPATRMKGRSKPRETRSTVGWPAALAPQPQPHGAGIVEVDPVGQRLIPAQVVGSDRRHPLEVGFEVGLDVGQRLGATPV